MTSSTITKTARPVLEPVAHPAQLLRRKCDCGNHTVAGGKCGACAKQGAAPRGGAMQAKLSIGASDDPLELEADAVAERVMNGAGSVSGVLAAPAIQRHSAPAAASAEVPGSIERALAGAGRPIDKSLRQDMEQRFGHDFSGVRLHSGTAAEQSAREVQARAYTVGRDIVFGTGQFAPETAAGRRLLAHELTHVVQQSAGAGVLRRMPAAPTAADGRVAPLDPGKVDIAKIPDVMAPVAAGGKIGAPTTVGVKFSDPAITHLSWELYDPADGMLDGFSTMTGSTKALSPFVIQNTDPVRPQWKAVQGRHLLRCVGYNNANAPIAYADRNFYLWTSTPTANYAGLVDEKAKHEANVKRGSGKSLGDVGSSFAKLKDVTHDIAVLETGTGTYEGKQCTTNTAGAIPTDCTDIVLEVLRNTFTQQGLTADWLKVEKQYKKNIASRGDTGLSGIDIQAALQSVAGWKGIYWAPDPDYQVPAAELDKARSDEASFTSKKASGAGTYYKDFHKTDRKKKGYPGVKIDQSVTDYAPEAPNAGYGTASTTTKSMGQLNKLKKLPFGVLAAHGGQHMTIITYGKVIEVHWDKPATSLNVIEQTDLESWAVGPRSGYHYFASGAIVAPAADVDAAFR